MKRSLLFALGIAGLVATVFALRGASGQDALRVDYYANGQVQAECEVQDGVRDGLSRRYWPDGKPMAEGHYRSGSMHGSWTFWNQDGSEDLERTGEYVDGKLVGS